ncbi:AraC family transcriptional regulator [Dyadobacter sp. OTU695]|uniref:AraC family transcriptional regulator n=1 Tax=Dyadobacter sp. OTU695 TaxID=3043860 RepID=UPI00313EC3EB
MICQEFTPDPQLRCFVQCYQLRYFVAPNGTTLPYKPYAPRPEQTLAFFPRGSEQVEYLANGQIVPRPRSVIIGQHTERTNRHLMGPEFCVLIVNFHPGVLYRMLGVPLTELTNTFIDAEAVLPKIMVRVNERLGDAASPQEMIDIVENLLLGLARNLKKDQHAVDLMTRHLLLKPENTSVIEMAESSCFSARQFERLFKQRMGISPKLFARIARMTKAFALKYNRPDLDWLSIALLCNYHDYQHLARDFKDLAGVTPAEYYTEEKGAPERSFGLQDSSISSNIVAFLPPAII